MSRRMKTLVGVLAAGLVLAVGVKAFERPLATLVLERMIDQGLSGDVMARFEDGLHVGLCGSSGPMPDRERRAACVFVIAGGALYVVDAGSGAAGTIGSMGLPRGQIKAVFLTHFHSDHIDGLGELMMNRWVQSGSTQPLPVKGPVGVVRVVDGLGEAYALDAGYRTAHHGEVIAPASGTGGIGEPFDLGADPMASMVVLDEGGLKVTAFNVDHAPITPSVGYRFDYGGRSVVISGDTAPSASLQAQAHGVDVLVHEALQRSIIKRFEAGARERGMTQRAKIMHDIVDYHTSPEEAAEIAAQADASYLLLYHIVPALPSIMDAVFLGDAGDNFDGPITIGTDGFMLSLPVHSDAIIERELL